MPVLFFFVFCFRIVCGLYVKVERLCESFMECVTSFQQCQGRIPLFDGERGNPALHALKPVPGGTLIEVQPRLLLVVPASSSDFMDTVRLSVP